MLQWEHGGDCYRNKVLYDFSVNVNPLGIPDSVRCAMEESLKHCDQYPDLQVDGLRSKLAMQHGIEKDCVLCGNGASELLMAVCHALNPKKIVIPTPSFYGYEYVTKSMEGQITFYPMKKEKNYCLDESLFDVLGEQVDLLVMASPNNPIGNVISDELLQRILLHCRKHHIFVLLDQCFIDFVREKEQIRQQKNGVKDLLSRFPNLLLLRAFTKTYCIPGIRLGYLCAKKQLALKVQQQLPEWNVSVIAQAAGEAACQEQEFVKRSERFITTEREWMVHQLQLLGIKCFESMANYVMLYCEVPLYEELLKRGILIRDCQNFRGLESGYYRVAVKTHKENEILCEAIEKCLEER